MYAVVEIVAAVSELQHASACKCAEAKRRAAKQNITEAMTNQDVDKLKQAIADGSGVLSDSELAHAKKLLDFLKISQGSRIMLFLQFVNKLVRKL